MKESSNQSERISEFEHGRRNRETANELLIHASLGSLSLIASILMLVVVLLPTSFIQPPVSTIIAEALVALLCGIVYITLRKNPGYFASRKYLLTILDLACIFFIERTGSALGHPEMTLTMPIAAFSFAIILASLRYSMGAVILAGAGSILLLMFITLSSNLEITPAVLGNGSGYLIGATVVLAFMVQSMIHLHRQAVSKDRLGRFLAPEVLREINNASELTLEAVEREVTIVFADISNFTRMASSMNPKETVQLLNDYFPPMVDIVFKHRGTLEKYIGDALLAVWGAPIDSEKAADEALAAAVEMQQRVREMNQTWSAKGRPTIRIHIGIHTGRVAAGHIGTDQYIQYACIGDTTNLASRICDKARPGEILISATTSERLLDNKLNLHRIPKIELKGKAEPLDLYKVKFQA